MAGVTVVQSDDAAFLVMGGGSLGVAIFTMGFAVDRLYDFKKRDHQAYMENMIPPE